MSDELPLSAQVDVWRQKVLNGTISDEDLRQAIEVLREGRRAASERGARAKAPSTTQRSAADILGKFKPKTGEKDDQGPGEG